MEIRTFMAAIVAAPFIATALLALASLAIAGVGLIGWTAYFQPLHLLSPGGAGLCLVTVLDVWLLRRVISFLKK